MGIKQPSTFLVGSRHISWVFKISLFYRTSIKTETKGPPSPWDTGQWAGDKIPEKWVGWSPSQLCGRIHKDSPHFWVQRSTVLGVSALREKNKRHWQPRRERGAQSPLLGCPQQNNLKGRQGPSAPDETELEEVQRVLPGNPSAGMAAERQKGIPRLLLSLRWILGCGDGLKSEERPQAHSDQLLDSPAHQAPHQASSSVSFSPPPD